MTERTTVNSIEVLIRYFAAARSAAGVETITISIPVETAMETLITVLGENNPKLSDVLARCSFLRNSRAVLDMSTVLEPGDEIDVLPPFSGG